MLLLGEAGDAHGPFCSCLLKGMRYNGGRQAVAHLRVLEVCCADVARGRVMSWPDSDVEPPGFRFDEDYLGHWHGVHIACQPWDP